jgi:polyisoprenoid-binding protein YceI
MRWLLACLTLTFAMPAPAAPWCINEETSRLGFAATQNGDAFRGEFRDYQAELRFDPDALAGSGFKVTVVTASADTGKVQRDQMLRGTAWFHSEAHPQARFETTEIRSAAGDARYEAIGDLTIRATTRQVALPFEWRIDGDTASMIGRLTLDRTAFGVGRGQWSDCSTVGCEVEVQVDLELQRCSPAAQEAAE